MSRKIESYHDLIVWQKSHELVLEIYSITNKFPKREHASLARRLRESAIDIPMNIATGFKKRGGRTKIHFYLAALTALESVRYGLILIQDLKYVKSTVDLQGECDNVEKMLKRLIRSIASS